ncbi:uncharacterized protein LOC101862288 isoform X2 [Aplysia californica]|uniref:Uncharacterized protein LOC101862288 isoform X2 n=1 Tax=Aplysia californica TaxID=6500 RepID=A0ABM0JX54_APLCA|nr:uncharacterized protein LOC101862288 isoform X2 [Aplysia californica]
MSSKTKCEGGGLAQMMSFDCLGFLPGDDVIQAMEIELMKRWGLSIDFKQSDSPPKAIGGKNRTNRDTTELEQAANEVTESTAMKEKAEVQKTECNGSEGSIDTPTSVGSSSRTNLVSDSSVANDGNVMGHVVASKTAGNNVEENVQRLYDEAVEILKKGNYCDSLILVDDALELIGPDDWPSCRPRWWILKAKVLNAMGDHVEALRSLQKVKIKDRSEDAWIEGATALGKLELHVTSEVWLKKALLSCMKPAGGEQRTCPRKLTHMLQAVRSGRIYDPLVKDTPIEINFTGNGREVRAERKISRGETIFKELPEILDQSISSHKRTACDRCGRSLVKPEDIFSKGHLACAELQKAFKRFWPKKTPVSCGSCDRVVYCSDSCRLEAWGSYHRAICPSSPETTAAMLYDVRKSFRDVMASDGSSWQGWWNNEFSPTLMAKVWASIMCQAKLLAASDGRESATKSDWFTAGSQFEKYSTSRDEPVKEVVPKMFELLNCHFRRCKVLHYDITEKNFNRKYHQIATNYITFYDASDPLRKFVDKVTTDNKMYKRIGKYFHEPLPKAEFHGLFPMASCLNHSCAPNAMLECVDVDGRPGIRIIATSDIDNGEEIRISYVDSRLERKERRRKLLKRFGFLCQCLKCQHEGDFPEVCTYCGKNADITDRESIQATASGAKTVNVTATVIDNVTATDIESDNVTATGTKSDNVTATGTESDNVTATCTESDNVTATCTESDNITCTESDDITCTESDNVSATSTESDNLSASGTENTQTSSLTEDAAAERRTPGGGDAKITSALAAGADSESASDTSSCSLQTEEQASIEGERTKYKPETNQEPKKIDSKPEKQMDDSQKGSANDSETRAAETNSTNSKSVSDSSDEVKTAAVGVEPIISDSKTQAAETNSTNSKSVSDSSDEVKTATVGVEAAKKFPTCGRCKKAWYCSQRCQKEAWKKGHKKICVKV